MVGKQERVCLMCSLGEELVGSSLLETWLVLQTSPSMGIASALALGSTIIGRKIGVR
jgi:hypothetical protein